MSVMDQIRALMEEHRSLTQLVSFLAVVGIFNPRTVFATILLLMVLASFGVK